MIYNVWFPEALELSKSKMLYDLGDLIQYHKPDLICFQEVTSNIYQLRQKSGWWQEYKCSLSDKMAMVTERPYFCMQKPMEFILRQSGLDVDTRRERERHICNISTCVASEAAPKKMVLPLESRHRPWKRSKTSPLGWCTAATMVMFSLAAILVMWLMTW